MEARAAAAAALSEPLALVVRAETGETPRAVRTTTVGTLVMEGRAAMAPRPALLADAVEPPVMPRGADPLAWVAKVETVGTVHKEAPALLAGAAGMPGPAL
jgi:hypothetical protein